MQRQKRLLFPPSVAITAFEKNVFCRLGGGPNDYKDVMGHKFFESINFDDLLAKKVRNN